MRVDLLREFQVIARRLNALATLPDGPYSIVLSLSIVVDSAQPGPSLVRGTEDQSAASPGPRSGVTAPLVFSGTKLPISSGDLESQLT